MEGSLSAHNLKSDAPAASVQLPRSSSNATDSSDSNSPPFFVGSDPDCDLRIEEFGWAPRHLAFRWSRKYSTWMVKNVSTQPVQVDSQFLHPNQTLPLLLWQADIVVDAVRLRFQRNPDPPLFAGKEVFDLPLTKAGLVIGRGPKNKDESMTPRLALDADILSISAKQAAIRAVGADYLLVNHNPSPTGRTILNGDQNFEERKLVLGDCIQIPNCDYYTFKFTGKGLRHLGHGGALQGLNLTVDVKGGRILHTVNLELKRGGFLGIIGGSGQGKSTLMNCLCGIVPATSGSVLVDGVKLTSPRDVARAGIGYVPQDDIVHRELTVIEALTYAAQLRLKAGPSQLRDLIETTMDTLRLTEHRNKQIANLSGGQRKRVSIASELLVSPDYIFLDEPTSGLDPQTERSLMGELSLLARRKRIGVASTTHVLQNCHVMTKLAFISRGRLIFHGKPVDAVRFFLHSGTPDGAAKIRTAQESASASGFGSSMAADSTASFGEDSHVFTEADLLSKIAHIYDIAQDTTKPIAEQDAIAAGWEREYQTPFYYEPPSKIEPPERRTQISRAPQVDMLRSLVLLVSRQWKILASSRLNYLFLLAQSVVIGLLISWVDENLVLQMFLSLIAALWFGCSNGATQIVSELAIYRRERLSGLGIQTYLLSKYVFWTAITGLQGCILFLMVLCGSPIFHPNPQKDVEEAVADFRGKVPDRDTREFRKAFFDKEWNALAAGDDRHDSGTATSANPTDAAPAAKVDTDFGIVGLEVDENNKRLPQEAVNQTSRVYVNPTGLRVTDTEYRIMENVVSFFRLRENVLDSLAVRPVKIEVGQSVALATLEDGAISWLSFVFNLVALRLGAFMAAALVGVALGLAVSSLVNTPTQAVMWVPLILIPQILFGSFVVIVPEMDDSVLTFSRMLPSFNLQRIMDVGLIYGQSAPNMTNQTRIPAFLGNPPNQKEVVEWDGNQTSYDKISQVNKSWQNLVVSRERLGGREKVTNTKPGQPPVYVDSVEQRPDVNVQKGNRYLDLQPAFIAMLVLSGWALACYGISVTSLYSRQTGR